ncbi:MAG: GNAT family N-acetyltransferase [Alphaproteobacteria bacterium]|nr:GNAT family N-acetyltransferase [Alphaproteobacteria bacterium]
MTTEIETKRLILRPMAPKDFEPLAAMMADSRVAEFLSFNRQPQSRAICWRGFATMIGHWRIRGFGFFSVFEKEGGAWVGRVGPWRPEGWPGLECGWGIAPAYWGKGYAPEAAIASIQWIFRERPQLSRIISLIEPSNARSQSVARKIGEAKTDETFQLEGFALDIWAADREAWLERFG